MSGIQFEIRDGIAFITLNRPDKLNSFTREMALLLQNRLDECASLREIRGGIFDGGGKGFFRGTGSGGSRRSRWARSPRASAREARMARILREQHNLIVTRIRNLPKAGGRGG